MDLYLADVEQKFAAEKTKKLIGEVENTTGRMKELLKPFLKTFADQRERFGERMIRERMNQYNQIVVTGTESQTFYFITEEKLGEIENSLYVYEGERGREKRVQRRSYPTKDAASKFSTLDTRIEIEQNSLVASFENFPLADQMLQDIAEHLIDSLEGVKNPKHGGSFLRLFRHSDSVSF